MESGWGLEWVNKYFYFFLIKLFLDVGTQGGTRVTAYTQNGHAKNQAATSKGEEVKTNPPAS